MKRIVPALFLALSLSWSSLAQAAPNFLLILDGTAGPATMEAVKPVLASLVRDLPEGIQAGFYYYPKPTAEACLPVQEIVPLGTLDKAAFQRAVAGLVPPSGGAPSQLDMAAATQRIMALRGSVIAVMISTGLETCEDPCLTVGVLKALGVPFSLRIVGYRVPAASRQAMDCLSRSSGGTYAEARDAGELVTLGRRAFQIVNLRVRAVDGKGPLDAVVEVKSRGGNPVTAKGSTGRSGVADFLLPDGVYDVVVKNPADAMWLTFNDLRLTQGALMERTASFGSGSGAQMRVKVVKNGAPFDAQVEIVNQDDPGRKVSGMSGGDPATPYALAPGVYTVRVRDPGNPARPPAVMVNVQLKPDTQLAVPFFFDEGMVLVRAVRAGAPFNAKVEVFSPGEKEPLAAGMSGGGEPQPFAVLPGSYSVVVSDPAAPSRSQRMSVNVSPGQTAVVDAVLR